jgi:hypothetical protein
MFQHFYSSSSSQIESMYIVLYICANYHNKLLNGVPYIYCSGDIYEYFYQKEKIQCFVIDYCYVQKNFFSTF